MTVRNSKRPFSVALPASIHDAAAKHLLRSDGQEDLCFALWYPSEGANRTTALINELLLPRAGDRLVHGNASFLPQYFERAVGEAIAKNAGLSFFHSHGGPGWQDMSLDDIEAEHGHAAATKGATGLPLVGLTLGTDGAWSARFWQKAGLRSYQHEWCTHVRVVGERLSVTFANHLIPPPARRKELQRTISAWGDRVQRDLARLCIGIVGAGSVGSIVAEALARTGIARVVLIDFDTVEVVNLDRSLHAINRHAQRSWSKVRATANELRRRATANGFEADEVEFSIAEEEGYRAALDCDVLFSCVDRPWPRSILNFIAYAHLIPVVDGGIRVETKPTGALRRADWKDHIASPDRRCLECLGQYNPGLVTAERDGYFDDPRYIVGLPKDHPMRQNENVFAFSLNLASLEVLQMLMMVVAPLGVATAGEQMYHFVPGFLEEPAFHVCREGCPYPSLVARGDRTGLVLTDRHIRAEQARLARSLARRQLSWRDRLGEQIEVLVDKIFR